MNALTVFLGFLTLVSITIGCNDDDPIVGTGPIDPNTVKVTSTLSGDNEIIEYDPQIGIDFSTNLDDGTTLQMEIPPNPFDTRDLVSLEGELIDAVNNLPPGISSLVSLNFEPSGFEFFQPAILTIGLSEIPSGLMGYSISNGQFRLVPIVVGPAGNVRMNISHFSSIGLIFGDTSFDFIPDPTSPDDFLHNIALNAANQNENEVDKWLKEWKEKYIDPKLASASTLETILEVTVTLLEFAANKQMLGVADISADLARARDLIFNGIEILERECNASECKREVVKSVVFWIEAAQMLGAEIETNDFFDSFCDGAILDVVDEIQIGTTNSINITEGDNATFPLSLINSSLQAFVVSSKAYAALESRSMDPSIADISINVSERTITVEALSLGSTTVFVEDPCYGVKDSILVEVTPLQKYGGTVIILCDSTFTGFNSTINSKESWELSIEAEAKDFGQGLEIVDAVISGVVSRERTSCDNTSNICTTSSDQQEFDCSSFSNDSGVLYWSACSNQLLGQPVTLTFDSNLSTKELSGNLRISGQFTNCNQQVAVPRL